MDGEQRMEKGRWCGWGSTATFLKKRYSLIMTMYHPYAILVYIWILVYTPSRNFFMASPNSYEKPSPWNQRQSLCSLAQSRENLSAIATTAKRAVLKTGSVAELYVNSCLGSFDSKMSYWFKRLFLRVFFDNPGCFVGWLFLYGIHHCPMNCFQNWNLWKFLQLNNLQMKKMGKKVKQNDFDDWFEFDKIKKLQHKTVEPQFRFSFSQAV